MHPFPTLSLLILGSFMLLLVAGCMAVVVYLSSCNFLILLQNSNSVVCYLTCFQRDNNALKIFVGGIANGTTEDDLRNYFSAYGKVLVINNYYDLFICCCKNLHVSVKLMPFSGTLIFCLSSAHDMLNDGTLIPWCCLLGQS